MLDVISTESEARQRVVGAVRKRERVIVDEPEYRREEFVHALSIADLRRQLAEDEQKVGQAMLSGRGTEIVDFGEAGWTE